MADRMEARIRAERQASFGSLNLPQDFIVPHFGGLSILNLPASIVRLLGGQLRSTPLDPAILANLSSGVERVVLVIVDALGYRPVLDILSDNPQNGFQALRDGAVLVPLTSVFPSTTSAALTSIWTGYSPAEHGLLGYVVFLREFNVRANLITFNPAATDKLGKEMLVAAGLEPEAFVPVPSLPQALAPAGVPVYNLVEQPFVKSALSRMQTRGVRETRGFVTSSDLWTALQHWLVERPGERALFVAYWSAVDSIAHLYGPSPEALAAEVNNLAYSFEREFLRRLSPAARQGTLFLLTSDHGQIATPPDGAVYLRDHPELNGHLVMGPAGESRAAYLYCRHGEAEAAQEYLVTRLPEQFFALDSQAALSAGLFGSGRCAPESRYRVGDLIVLAREHYVLSEHKEPPKLLGRHGGLSPEEMLVPLLAARLDG